QAHGGVDQLFGVCFHGDFLSLVQKYGRFPFLENDPFLRSCSKKRMLRGFCRSGALLHPPGGDSIP
ncbi:MAG: hypothetical protein IKG89_04050, partial [Oscillospiraceae bacterium]|nr:hypothetical protein [Oscillospiraceae bacterium]